MSEESDREGGTERAEAISLYMEALKARMAPEQYEQLERLVHETAHLIAHGQEGVFGEDDEPELSVKVQRELARILAMMLTGGTEHRVVEMPGPDGSSGFAIVEASAADDPARLAQMQAGLQAWADERKAIDAELEGIARASEQGETG
ncbi:hypothetical protein [Streptomyces albus]|uniref:hypothetical protein n=1 Tax=Streptomyces albus TaxID=1888 RepID=UPI0024E160A3|nr:hypothetical protein [Streptomyces albus]GHJ19072.1 hypothetical protein TPA0909_06860 [Streptomyces albus]